ncbi:helix-turn-helix domain-containing protein [Glutamicibacter nicotianae]|uniref:helix-turn-helix domain-containing protein n=1 Tax=Glutamicibacter nicotianae TaxID=37929 RepID=UPI002556CED8|nr:helix-turn-helix domain-containing protein [Glutamicibacter nicotianae]WIV43055.1 helix-turn-helix domain-containing protein [Glutamicibacter nicotianae]
MTAPIDEARRNQIVKLAQAGKSRNDIAKEIGCSPSTVTRWAHRAGIEFDRSATQAATEARKMDLKALRNEAALRTIRRVLDLDDRFKDATDSKTLRDLAASLRDASSAHFNVSRLDMGSDADTETAKASLRDFIIGAKERAKEIEAEQHRRDILEQPDQPELETRKEQDRP